MLARLILFVLFIMISFNNEQLIASPLEASVMGLSAASSMKNLKNDSFLNFGGIFTPEGNVDVEEVNILVDEDMNEKSGVTIYFVICYDKELLAILKTDSASQFNSRFKEGYYTQKFDDKMFVLKWTKPAKKDAESYDIAGLYEKEYMVPLCGFIYVTYSTPGEHIYIVPGAWKKIRIHLKKRDFEVQEIKE